MKNLFSSLMIKTTTFLFILILPFNILGVIIAIKSYRNSIDNIDNMILYTMDSYAALLENQMANTNSLLYNINQNDSNYLTLIKQEDNWKYEFAYYNFFSTFSKQMETANAMDEFVLYLEQKDIFFCIPYSDDETEWMLPYIESFDRQYTDWHLIAKENGLYLIRLFHDPVYHVYCSVSISLQEMLDELQNAIGFETITFQFLETPVDSSLTKLSWNSKINNHLYLNATISQHELNSSVNIIQHIFVLLFIIYFALIPVLIYLMKRYVGNPLRELNQGHREVENGNDGYQITAVPHSIEFSGAFDSFNEMSSSLQKLKNDVFTKELDNKQLRIDFLQLQIRPHFLLNSFNVLYTLIQNGFKQPAQDMVLYLSDYFRYLFRSGRELQLFSKELNLIENYIYISKIYYPTSFEISYQIDPVIQLMRVPPLLLHSFIENIIQHALMPERVIHIIFSGEYEDGVVTFYISDDGKGMDPETVETINNVDKTNIDNGKNVGIKNSIRRLKHYYGDGASAAVDSELGVGTTFTITIPYDLEEKEYEFIDCE